MLKLPGINATTHSNLKDIEFKKLIKVYTIKNLTLKNKESASSSSEALTAMVFLSSSDYDRFVSIIAYLRQDMPKGNYNYLSIATNTYAMIKRFEFAPPRHHCIRRTGDKGNRENCGGHGGRESDS